MGLTKLDRLDGTNAPAENSESGICRTEEPLTWFASNGPPRLQLLLHMSCRWAGTSSSFLCDWHVPLTNDVKFSLRIRCGGPVSKIIVGQTYGGVTGKQLQGYIFYWTAAPFGHIISCRAFAIWSVGHFYFS